MAPYQNQHIESYLSNILRTCSDVTDSPTEVGLLQAIRKTTEKMLEDSGGTGSKQYSKVGIHHIRAMLDITSVSAPVNVDIFCCLCLTLHQLVLLSMWIYSAAFV